MRMFIIISAVVLVFTARGYSDENEKIVRVPDADFFKTIMNKDFKKPFVIPDSVIIKEDIKFSSTKQKDLFLDTYDTAEKKMKKRPAAIFFHGGGFVKGDKKTMAQFAAYFAVKHGFFCVSANYRLRKDFDKYNHEKYLYQVVRDGKNAVQWVVHMASKYKIDTEKIIVSGESAGSNLALATGLFDDNFGLEDEIPEKIIPAGIRSFLLLNPSFFRTEVYKKIPLEKSHVLAFFGSKDVKHLEPYKKYHAQLSESNISSKLIVAPNRGHSYCMLNKGSSADVINTIELWLKKVL